jgi:tetratricopeptide (TPR) repeat protein
MKYYLLIPIFFIFINVAFSQNKSDDENEKAIKLYNEGKEDKAIKIWKKIMKTEPDTSRNYGMAVSNILYKYFKNENVKEAEKYYRIIVNSNLNDYHRTPDIMEPFANYRHHSAMRMASLYAQKGKYNKALEFIEKADNVYQYLTISINSYMFKVVDLAFWKSKLYKDLGKFELSKYVLIERAFDNDYKNQFKDWLVTSPNNEEEVLANAIFKEFKSEELNQLQNDIDMAFEELKIINNGKEKFAIFQLMGLKYQIPIYNDIDILECVKKFKNIPFYQMLKEKNDN